MANVRDLLIRVLLSTDEFKNKVAEVKREIGGLKGSFKEVSSEDTIGIAGDKVLEKLKSQKTAAEKLVELYKQKIAEIQQELTTKQDGSQAKTFLEIKLETFQGKLQEAQESLDGLQAKVDNFSLDKLIEKANTTAQIFADLRLGFGGMLNGLGEMADSADEVFVGRENAWTGVEKIMEGREGYTKKFGEELRQWNEEVITYIPVTFNALSVIEENALQAGGVALEGVRSFAEMYAELEAATNIQGKTGVQKLGKYFSLMDVVPDEYHRLASVIVDLGNKFPVVEDEIVNTATRAGSAMKAAGLTAQDGLAMVAAARSMGMNEAASATSLEKIIGRSAKAAELGLGEYQRLLKEIKRKGNGVETVYDFQIAINSDPEKYWFQELEKQMHMTKTDLQRLVNNAIVLEKYSDILGITPEEFSRQWSEDAAMAVIAFFDRLGQMDKGSFEKMYQGMEGLGDVANDNAEEAEKGILTLLDSLGIVEVRAARLARNFASNSDELRATVNVARTAYAEDKALDEEAQRRYATNESRRIMNRNKEENALAATGASVVAMRKPFEDFFAQLKQWYVEDWPAWAQEGAGYVINTMGTIGDGLKTAGDLSFSFASILSAGREIKKSGWDGKLLSGLKTAGKIGLGAGAIAGTYLFAKYLTDAADATDDIATRLSSLEFKIDEQSKEATLSAIREVRDAAGELSGEKAEKYAATSRVVQMGYGTAGMYGQALAYEQQRGEKEIAAVYERYGALIQEQEEAMLRSPDDETARQAIQDRIAQLTSEMEAAAAEKRAELSRTLNSVISGAIQQTGGDSALQGLAERYNALDMVFGVWNEYQANGQQQQKLSQSMKETLRDTMNSLGYYDWAKQDPWGGRKIVWDRLDASAFKNMANFLYEQLEQDVKSVAENGQLMSVLATAISSGSLNEADQSQFSGTFLALLQAMDIKSISDQGVKNWLDIGKNSMLGLGQGIDENSGNPKIKAENAAQSLIDAAKAILKVQSPSQVFFDIGENVALGLANGIYSKADEAIKAASWLAGQIEETMRNAMDIHSPSGVARLMGGYFSQGLALGIEDGVSRVEYAIDKFSNAVNKSRSSAHGSQNMPKVDVTIRADSKKLAEALAPEIDNALGAAAWPM